MIHESATSNTIIHKLIQHTFTIELVAIGRSAKRELPSIGMYMVSSNVIILDLANSLIKRSEETVVSRREKRSCQSHCDGSL